MGCRVSSALIAQIKGAARASPGREICGLLLGAPDRIDAIVPCRNVAPRPADSFEIDPIALIAKHRAARNGGPAVIGHYHSHPEGGATPSPRDAAAARPDGALWLIVAGKDLLAWRAVRDGAVEARFDPVALDIAAACAAESSPPEDG